MAKPARVVINRRAADELLLGLADGLFDLGVGILLRARAEVPDLPPLTQGLIEGGGAISYVGTKKVAGTTIGGRAIKKGSRMRTQKDVASVFVGFGFPGRFVHNGSIHNDPDPFLARAMTSELPSAASHIAPPIRRAAK